MKRLLYCSTCKQYTLKPTCSCGKTTVEPKPAKYSPEDKYAAYRRSYKYELDGKKESKEAD